MGMKIKFDVCAVATLLFVLFLVGSCQKKDAKPIGGSEAYSFIGEKFTYPGFVYDANGKLLSTSAGGGSNLSGVGPFLSIIHAAPLIGTLDVSIDKNRLGLKYFGYTDRIDYFRTFAGQKTFSVYGAEAQNPLFSKGLQFDGGKYYTVLIADTLSRMDAVMFRDSSQAPGPDSVKIRFINMSPDVGNLDLYVRGQEIKVAENIGYKEASSFISINAGRNLALDARPAGEKSIWASVPLINLLNGNIYTIWATGFVRLTTDNGRIRLESIRH